MSSRLNKSTSSTKPVLVSHKPTEKMKNIPKQQITSVNADNGKDSKVRQEEAISHVLPSDSIDKEKPVVLSRAEKLKIIGLDEKCSKKDMNDKMLDKLYQIHLDKQKELTEPKSTKKKKTVKRQTYNLDKNHPRQKLLLEFLNALLDAMGEPQIDDVYQFKDVKKSDLMTKECNDVIDQYIDRITDVFTKSGVYYSKRTSIDTYIITLLKRMVAISGYTLTSYLVKSMDIMETCVYKQTWNTFYSIE